VAISIQRNEASTVSYDPCGTTKKLAQGPATSHTCSKFLMGSRMFDDFTKPYQVLRLTVIFNVEHDTDLVVCE